MLSDTDLYRFHCANLNQVGLGLERVALVTRRSIAVSDQTTTSTMTPLYALLLGAWAECRLKKLLYESSGFDKSTRDEIRSLSTQSLKWKTSVEKAFRKRFKVLKAPISKSNVPFTTAARYKECQELLDNDLSPIIELRNRFAHGQWVYPLTNDEEKVNNLQIAAFKKENLLTLQYKKSLISNLANLVNDLVASAAFDRDFDKHYNLISQTRTRMQKQTYSTYVDRLKQRHAKGKA